MAKKRTAPKKRTRPVRSTPAAVRPPAPAAITAPAAAVPSPITDDIRAEYRYVITDLKRIGVTAAAMFALLVVLALVIT